MLDQRVAVGHAGDEIRGSARPVGFVPRLGSAPFRRQVRGLFAVTGKQGANHPLRITHDAHDTRMTVHPGIEKALDGAVGCFHLGREADHLPIGMTHIISRPRRQRLQAARGFGDHVLDHLGDEPTAQFMHHAIGLELRVFSVSVVEDAGDQRDAGEFLEGKKSGPQPVIDVMGIVGDVVGDGGNLSFGAGKAPELQVLEPGIVRPAIRPDRIRQPALAIVSDRAAVAKRSGPLCFTSPSSVSQEDSIRRMRIAPLKRGDDS